MKEQFYDLEYKTLTKDPLAAVRNIYKHFDLDLTPEVEASMKAYVRDNPQHKHGKHKYSLSDYGLSTQDMKRSFAPYLNYFGEECI